MGGEENIRLQMPPSRLSPSKPGNNRAGYISPQDPFVPMFIGTLPLIKPACVIASAVR